MKQFRSLIVLTVLATSCARVDQSADNVLLPRLAPALTGTGDARPQALLVGRLVVDQSCIKVENSGQMATVLWYSEVVRKLDPDNPKSLKQEWYSQAVFNVLDKHYSVEG